MLPEKQCDYLLALYTEGEGVAAGSGPAKSRFGVFIYIHCFLVALMIPLSFLLIYFTEFGTTLQLGFLLLFLVYAIFISAYFIRKGSRVRNFPFIITLLLLLIAVSYATTAFTESRSITIAAIILCFVIWFMAGRKMKMKYVSTSSAVGIIFVVLYAILQ